MEAAALGSSGELVGPDGAGGLLVALVDRLAAVASRGVPGIGIVEPTAAARPSRALRSTAPCTVLPSSAPISVASWPSTCSSTPGRTRSITSVGRPMALSTKPDNQVS
ncbi:MAG TPA: hypothetical protein VK357_12415, partial [Rubrobacteraceae bacterium]|nr:hypothetical protein [Rubrobacteraceae bacterium]